MDTELITHMAALPADDAKPGDGMRYLLEHAPFLAAVPQRINFRLAVRRMLREGRVAEAILAAVAYDARTLELHPECEGAVVDGSASTTPEVHPPGESSVAVPLDPAMATWRIEGAQPGGSG